MTWHFPRARAAVLLAFLVTAAACSDAENPAAPLAPARPLPGAEAGTTAFSCTAGVRARTFSCTEDGAAGGGARVTRIIGGQNVNVRLTGTNLDYDTATGIYRIDVTVQNLGVQRLGTRDGTLVTGVQVFFHLLPTVTASHGAGMVEVDNAHGYGDFTGTVQPFFHYPQVLPLDSVSAPAQWRFRVPRTVDSFVFKVFVRAEILPVVVFDYVQAGNRDIWRVAIDGSDLTRVTTHIGDDLDPTHALGRVVFTSYRNGNAELYSVPLTGGTETRLTTTAAHEVAPALSPDGTRLAFTSDVSGVPKLWVSAADGTGAARAAPRFGFPGSLDASPSWAPGSDRLAFAATSAGSADLYDLSLGGSPTLLAGGDFADIEPAWSADGRRIVFASNRTGDTELYLLSADGAGNLTQLTRLTHRAGSDGQPAWLADGRLAFVSPVGSTLRIFWLDPKDPSVVHAIPLPAGAAQRPVGVLF